jgi:hypothetical protein
MRRSVGHMGRRSRTCWNVTSRTCLIVDAGREDESMSVRRSKMTRWMAVRDGGVLLNVWR